MVQLSDTLVLVRPLGNTKNPNQSFAADWGEEGRAVWKRRKGPVDDFQLPGTHQSTVNCTCTGAMPTSSAAGTAYAMITSCSPTLLDKKVIGTRRLACEKKSRTGTSSIGFLYTASV